MYTLISFLLERRQEQHVGMKRNTPAAGGQRHE
jgi:hypothetical protein